jgi:hypothetical protein
MTPNNIVVLPEDAGIILSIEDRQNQGDSADGRVSFVRFDTSGNVVWKRHFGVGDGGSGINLSGSSGGMKLNRNGNIIFNTRFGSGGEVYTVVAQLPADGSLTGDTVIGSRTYNWSANTRFSFSDQSIFSKQGSSIFSSDTNSLGNNSYATNITTVNNVQTFTKGDVD